MQVLSVNRQLKTTAAVRTQHFSKKARRNDIEGFYLFYVHLRKKVFASFNENRLWWQRWRVLIPALFCFNSGAVENSRPFTKLVDWKTVLGNPDHVTGVVRHHRCHDFVQIFSKSACLFYVTNGRRWRRLKRAAAS